MERCLLSTDQEESLHKWIQISTQFKGQQSGEGMPSWENFDCGPFTRRSLTESLLSICRAYVIFVLVSCVAYQF